ncbi:hypothetical protein EDB85DRAFT_2159580 [Lactarius pseudohatsudake]|nr:hypothetical protein EDB85DRAFT_2159580 [Lactarius pseudohatsudake]
MPPKPKPTPPPIPITSQQIAGVLSSVSSGLEQLLASSPDQSDALRQHILAFLANPTVKSLIGGSPPPLPSSTNIPKNLLDDIAAIKKSLAALQKVTPASAKPGKPPSQANAPQSGPSAKPKAEAKAPSYAGTAALPPRPSVVISLATTDWNDRRPTPAQVCSSINVALADSQHEQVRISAARWTARDNLILMGGPNTTAHQLQLSIPTIRKHFTEKLSRSHDPTPIPIRPNLKWSKILINSVPTGVTPSTPARTPDECHAALVSENPSYAALTVTQRPSWVRSPTSYSDNALSSLVVAFEDPDGSLARGLMANKTLFIFGHCATLRKWKQRTHPSKDKVPSPPAKSPSPPDSPTDPLNISFQQLSADILQGLRPTPSPAGLPQESTQEMEEEEEFIGRPPPLNTRQSSRRK